VWSELAQAYESKLAVLEEARAAYSKSVVDVIAQVGPAMGAGIRDVLADKGLECQVESVIAESGDNAVLALAPWARTTIVDRTSTIEFRIAAWVASSWGGPGGTLRVALSLERVPSWLDLQYWINRSGELLGDSAPGESFDPLDWQRFPETTPEWRAIRIASIELDERDFREVAREAAEVSRALAGPIAQMTMLISDAALPITNAENALLRYRPTLEDKAERAGVSLWPSKNLGGWQGGKFLQVGSFWLASDPTCNRLLAACSKEDNEVVDALAHKLGEPIGRRGASPCITILTEEQLRGSEQDADAAVSAAFDFWFMTKAHELIDEAAIDAG